MTHIIFHLSIIAALAGWLALRWTGELSHVFMAQSVGLIASGFISLAAVAGGAWFGSLTWPWSTAERSH